jgi:hypothetical protein
MPGGFTKLFREKDMYDLVRKYPHFTESDGGRVKETIFHFKNNDGMSDYYGMGPHIAVGRDRFIDYVLTELFTKVSATEFVTKKLGTMKRKDSDTDGDKKKQYEEFQDMKKVINNMISNIGTDSKTLGIMALPSNMEKIEWEDLEVVRDHETWEFLLNKSQKAVLGSHGWDAQFLGLETAKSNIGGNVIHDIMVKSDFAVLRKEQNRMANFFMDVNNQLCEDIGSNEFVNTKYVLPRTAEEMRGHFSKKDSPKEKNEDGDE